MYVNTCRGDDRWPALVIHGRLPPRKGFVASGVPVSAAAIHPVSTATGRRPR
jgi:hypothetical protein